MRRGYPYPDAEKALVQPAAVANGVLTFWMSIGDMGPQLARVGVDLTSGKLERTWGHELVAPATK